MISLDIQKETSSLSPLNTVPTGTEEGELSFASLLKGTLTKADDNIIQNGSLLIGLKDDKPSTKTLLAVQDVKQSVQKDILELEGLEIMPEVKASLSPEDLKVLIKEAKQYLKEKILQSEGFKKSQMQSLPKTLGGLIQVAKKIGIDIAKITLEEVNAKGPKTAELLHVNTEKESVRTQKSQTKSLKEANKETATPIDEFPVEIKVKKQKTEKSQANETQAAQDDLEQLKKETPKNLQQLKQEPKQTPLFKAQSSAVEITTQQIVDTKVQNIIVQKSPKQKSDDTLQLLLRTDNTTSKSELGLTSDFSVATARVIAPQAVREADKSLTSLLKRDIGDDVDIQSKADGLNVSKADSFEVKLNEAKQMVKYLSQDVKSAIEDYKSPFTRVKVQLNPQRLGEVDLTVVQRGKNLHINISSNNTAINALAMNANDLKVQLNNNGINNASLNFNSNPQGDNSQAGQQEQHRQNQQRADEEYNYFESQEGNEEVLSSLEIVVPHYA